MKKFNHLLSVVGCFWILLTVMGCGSSGTSEPGTDQLQQKYQYQVPAQIFDGWTVEDLATTAIDVTAVETLADNIQNQNSGYLYIQSLIIAQNGKLLVSEQFRQSTDMTDTWAGNTNPELHAIHSVTKSINSILMGIAIEQGYVIGVDAKVHDFFVDRSAIQNWNTQKESISIENWLNMRSGYLWDEWDVNYLDSSNLNTQMINAVDPVQFLLDRPMSSEPGTTFAYSTGVSFGLGRIIQLATGQSIDSYLAQNLLVPLQIESYDFWSLDGQLHTGSGLYLTPRDMAKFGQMFLDGGMWNGNRVVSEEWVNQSTQQRVNLNSSGSIGYGYQWWMRNFNVDGQSYSAYYGDGFGGQYVIVVPELQLVIAMTGNAYEDGQSEARSIRTIIENDILPLFVDSVGRF